jgi:hypothetical protein
LDSNEPDARICERMMLSIIHASYCNYAIFLQITGRGGHGARFALLCSHIEHNQFRSMKGRSGAASPAKA